MTFRCFLSKCSEVFTCSEVDEGPEWLCRQSDAHGLPDAVHTADVTRGHLTGELSQVPRYLLSCRQKQTENVSLKDGIFEENIPGNEVSVESDHCLTVDSCLELKDKPRVCKWRTKVGHDALTERLLPSSSSLAVGASRQIMLGGCLALRRSFCASCKSRRSFVVSSNFCWKCRASVTDQATHTQLILPPGSSGYLVL